MLIIMLIPVQEHNILTVRVLGVPIFMGRLIHKFKKWKLGSSLTSIDTNVAMLSSSNLDFLDQLQRGQLTILMMK